MMASGEVRVDDATRERVELEIYNDWTIGGSGRSNSSDAYVRLSGVVENIIRESAHYIVDGKLNGVARKIVSNLAHKHDVRPVASARISFAAYDTAITPLLRYVSGLLTYREIEELDDLNEDVWMTLGRLSFGKGAADDRAVGHNLSDLREQMDRANTEHKTIRSAHEMLGVLDGEVHEVRMEVYGQDADKAALRTKLLRCAQVCMRGIEDLGLGEETKP